MKLDFDTKREEEIFREFLKDAKITEMRAELIWEAKKLIQKMRDYFE